MKYFVTKVGIVERMKYNSLHVVRTLMRPLLIFTGIIIFSLPSFALRLEITASECIHRAHLLNYFKENLGFSEDRLDRVLKIYQRDKIIHAYYKRGDDESTKEIEIIKGTCEELPRYIRVWVERQEHDLHELKSLKSDEQKSTYYDQSDNPYADIDSEDGTPQEYVEGPDVNDALTEGRDRTSEEAEYVIGPDGRELAIRRSGRDKHHNTCPKDCARKAKTTEVMLGGQYLLGLETPQFELGLARILTKDRSDRRSKRFALQYGGSAALRLGGSFELGNGQVSMSEFVVHGYLGIYRGGHNMGAAIGIKNGLGFGLYHGNGFENDLNQRLLIGESRLSMRLDFSQRFGLELGATLPWWRTQFLSLSAQQSMSPASVYGLILLKF